MINAYSLVRALQSFWAVAWFMSMHGKILTKLFYDSIHTDTPSSTCPILQSTFQTLVEFRKIACLKNLVRPRTKTHGQNPFYAGRAYTSTHICIRGGDYIYNNATQVLWLVNSETYVIVSHHFRLFSIYG